ncbi:MAG TPA: YciI family protein [Gemmatimonadaceae bacterium]|nr:YciI family protein [Gemmatimonadaceae bacterium]
MRFMIIRRADKNTEGGVMPDPKLLEAMGAFHEEMAKAGILLDGMGLHPTSKGALVKFRGGKATITDGPFAEAKELIAGFSIFEVKSREEAISWLKRWPPEDGHGNVELELRQFYEADDFGDEFTPAWREQEERLRTMGKPTP